ncbi:MAG: competence protein ComE [Chloroflexi bacterium]|nr:MAG: competence protein ComE [Chloroflexota bacterium]
MKKIVLSMVLLMFMVSAAWAKVNINTASVAELEGIPGIGPSKAESIVKYRDDNGKFQKAGDIVLVKGIGDKLFKKISSEIEVGK